MCPPSDESLRKPYHYGRIWRRALVLVGLGVVWVRFRPSIVSVEGESMTPALEPGRLLLVLRGLRAEAGDIVVVRGPSGSELVKRVSAGPGDEAMPGWVLGPDEWLVLGDNREASTDSREFGTLPGDAIVGRVVWPRR
jgi:signal peptidase I